jgi:hypothetical protein
MSLEKQILIRGCGYAKIKDQVLKKPGPKDLSVRLKCIKDYNHLMSGFYWLLKSIIALSVYFLYFMHYICY